MKSNSVKEFFSLDNNSPIQLLVKVTLALIAVIVAIKVATMVVGILFNIATILIAICVIAFMFKLLAETFKSKG